MSALTTHGPALEGQPWFLVGGGETAAVIGRLDAGSSPLGPPEAFPAALKHLLAATLTAAVQIVLFWGPDLVALYNDTYAPTIGTKHPRAMGRPARENWAELWDDLEPLLRSVLDTGETISARDRPFWIERGRGGETAYFDISYSPVRDETGAVAGVVCSVTETTERVTAAEALRTSERELRSLNETLEQRIAVALAERSLWAQVFETTDALVAILDRRYRILAFNRPYAAAFAHAYGFDLAIGDDVLALLADRPKGQAYLRAMWSRVLAGEDYTLVQEFGSKPDNKPYYELRFTTLREPSGEVAAAVLYGLDVTDRLRDLARLAETEEQLRQAQKMEAIGQLTGGIAHDFNNLLTGIMGSLDLMGTRLAQGRTDGLKRYADAALSSAGRAAALTHRLLAFSRRQPLDPRAVQANALVLSVEDLIRRTLGERIALDIRLAPDLWPTLCDENQLENAILNLVINARDAMPEGGRLAIATANRTLDDAEAALYREARPGEYVAVSVSDDGVGMGEDVIAHAFEPFFTTKPIGQGTGLGLSMIYGFAQQSGGHVAIESELGRGTTVALFLPRQVAQTVEEAAPAPPVAAAEGRGERVLVVEDEPMVRALVIELLTEHGYATLEAADGPSGLAAVQSAETIDLLVTDIGLPGLNGRQLAEAARQTRPDLRILFITGYAESAAQSSGFLEAGMALMTKPFAGDALIDKVRALIG